MTDKEIMQMALDALEEAYHPNTNVAVVMEALRAKLEQTDMQIGLTYEEANPPVAWMYVNTDEECEQIEYGEPLDDPSVTPLYTAPPQREWVGLTENDFALFQKPYAGILRWVEAALKERNIPLYTAALAQPDLELKEKSND